MPSNSLNSVLLVYISPNHNIALIASKYLLKTLELVFLKKNSHFYSKNTADLKTLMDLINKELD